MPVYAAYTWSGVFGPGHMPPAELDAFVRKEVAHWAKVVKDNNTKSGDQAPTA